MLEGIVNGQHLLVIQLGLCTTQLLVGEGLVMTMGSTRSREGEVGGIRLLGGSSRFYDEVL